MKKTSPTAMLTVVLALAGSVAVSGCGGKSGSSTTTSKTSSNPTTTPATTTKHKSKPAY
ncbi:MAG TPA: hypothetical protein VII01_17285 [Solirubrobacteraceae bacterium]